MHPLHVRALDVWRDARCGDPLLSDLLDRALRGEGEVLRLSPRRLVLRLADADGAPWVLKLDAPQRRWEGVRRLRTPPPLREARLARRLAARLPEFPPARAASAGRGRSLLARPFVPGADAARTALEAPEAVAHGLARLHELGWSDDDLKAEDLLWTPTGALLPMDLGRARLHGGATPERRRRGDRIRLLASLPPATAARLAAPVLDAAGSRDDPEELLVAAGTRRERALRRQARRALRENRDFRLRPDGGIERREPPDGIEEVHLLGRRAARALWLRRYEDELHGRPGPRVVALTPRADGWAVVLRRPAG